MGRQEHGVTGDGEGSQYLPKATGPKAVLPCQEK